MAGRDMLIQVLQNELLGSMQRAIVDGVDQAVQEVAAAVAADWKASAPVDSGDYRDSIHVQKGKRPAYAMVRTALPGGEPYDIYHEYGTEDQPARHVARQAADRHRKRLPDRASRKLKEATGG